MQTKAFETITTQFWDKHLARIWKAQEEGKLHAPVAAPIWLYPTSLQIIEAGPLLAFELVGTSRARKPLRVRTKKVGNMDDYLSPFQFPPDAPPFITFRGHNHVTHMTLVDPASWDGLRQRYPALESLHPTRAAPDPSWTGGPLLRFFGTENFINLRDCLLVNSYASAVRLRYVALLTVMQRTTDERTWRDHLQDEFTGTEDVMGVLTRSAAEEAGRTTAAQFASLFLQSTTSEVELGEFLRDHPELIYGAFSTDQFIYEPYLEWQEGTPSLGDTAINPDLLIRGADGTYDICDLKLPLMNRKSVTKGERRRRRFIDSVYEGAAQLAHYVEYFSYPVNREHAMQRYGVNVRSPRCILVVGQYENVRIEEVDEARRSLNNFELMDYDTVARLFLASESARGGRAR